MIGVKAVFETDATGGIRAATVVVALEDVNDGIGGIGGNIGAEAPDAN